jgi:hypothetical protein
MAAPVTRQPHHWNTMETTTTLAGAAGRTIGTAARGLLWAHRQIDWAEVAAIVLHGLQILICMTLLAGRWARRAWDALPLLSERLGRAYARLIVTPQPEPIEVPVLVLQPAVAVTPAPIITNRRVALEQLTNRELRELVGTRKRLAKRQLIELALAA